MEPTTSTLPAIPSLQSNGSDSTVLKPGTPPRLISVKPAPPAGVPAPAVDGGTGAPPTHITNEGGNAYAYYPAPVSDAGSAESGQTDISEACSDWCPFNGRVVPTEPPEDGAVDTGPADEGELVANEGQSGTASFSAAASTALIMSRAPRATQARRWRVLMQHLPCSDLKDIKKVNERSWNIIKHTYGTDNKNSRVERRGDGGWALRVFYPERSINPTQEDRPVGGLGFYAAPAILPGNDVELSYQVEFHKTFVPMRGGKLPGLFLAQAGVPDIKGGSGGRHSDKLASCRVMWRADLAAEAYVYATAAHDVDEYLNDISSAHYNATSGDSLWRGELRFYPSGWNTVRMRVRLNTVGRDDGVLWLEVNGVKRSFRKMKWRSRSDVVVAAFMMSTFFGGNKPEWACPRDTSTRFKDFVLRKWS